MDEKPQAKATGAAPIVPDEQEVSFADFTYEMGKANAPLAAVLRVTFDVAKNEVDTRMFKRGDLKRALAKLTEE